MSIWQTSIQNQTLKKIIKKIQRSNPKNYLRRPNDDVVDRNEDQLHEEADESHYHETDRRTERHLREFYTTKKLNPNFTTRSTTQIRKNHKYVYACMYICVYGWMRYLCYRACGSAWRGGRCPWRTLWGDRRLSLRRPFLCGLVREKTLDLKLKTVALRERERFWGRRPVGTRLGTGLTCVVVLVKNGRNPFDDSAL